MDGMTGLKFLELLIGYILCGLVGLFGIAVLWRIWSGDIDLNTLLCEKGKDGKPGLASMSRFQLLIFTFVIALSLFLIVVANTKILQDNYDAKNGPPKLPDVPGGVLALLGISASSYTVSKAISGANGKPGAQAGAAPGNPPPQPPPQHG